MTADPTPLQERLWDAIFEARHLPGKAGEASTVSIVEAILPIIAAEAQAASEKAWNEGHSWGWSDAQEAHDTRQVMPRSEWRLCTPNPYRTERPMTDHPFTPHADSIQTAWVLMCQQSRIATQPPVEELEAEFDRFLARVRRDAAREALRNVEVQLVGELSAGTYLADWATLTARDVRGGIWHVYDRIPEETP